MPQGNCEQRLKEYQYGRPAEAAALIKGGHSPAAIAEQLHISFSSAKQYLCTAVGLGFIYRSQIVFTIDGGTISAVESAVEHNSIRNCLELERILREDSYAGIKQFNVDEALWYFELREAALTDMYELLSRLERFLHEYIRLTLEQTFGPKWLDKLPKNVQKRCFDKRLEDREQGDDLYSYTDFIHLHDIFEEHWDELSKNFPGQVRANRKNFLQALQKLNGIRNKVMHPVHRYIPKSADFQVLSNFIGAILTSQ